MKVKVKETSREEHLIVLFSDNSFFESEREVVMMIVGYDDHDEDEDDSRLNRFDLSKGAILLASSTWKQARKSSIYATSSHSGPS